MTLYLKNWHCASGFLIYCVLFSNSAYGQDIATYPIDSFTYDAPMMSTHADIDGDSDEDVIVQFNYTNLAWYENTGGQISDVINLISVPSNLDDIVTADMDNDGDLDIVVHSYGTRYIAWIENVNGDASLFETHIILDDIYDFGPGDAQVGDIDNDGDQDIAVILNADFIAWYENDGAAEPAFTLHTISTPTHVPSMLRLGDFDNDGDLDIITYTSYDGELYYYVNYGGGSYSTMGAYRGSLISSKDMAVNDMDMDGDQDLVICAGTYAAGDESISVFWNGGVGVFGTVTEIYSDQNVSSIEVAEFNGDTLPDILAYTEYGGLYGDAYPMNSFIFVNAGGATFHPIIYPLNGLAEDYYLSDVISATSPDINSDGRSDMWGFCYNAQYTAIATGNMDTLFTDLIDVVRVKSDYGQALGYHSADDSEMQVIVFDNYCRTYQYAFDDTSQSIVFMRKLDSLGYSGYGGTYSSALLFDMENDGDEDLFLATKYESQNMHVYEHLDDDIFAAPLNFGYDEFFCMNPDTADINGDGFTDIIASHYISVVIGYDADGFEIYQNRYKCFWLENVVGTGDFLIHYVGEDYFAFQDVPVASDFDMDGDLDIYMYNTFDDILYKYTNTDGEGNFTTRYNVLYDPSIRYFDFFDENNDGAPDLIYNTSDSLNVRLNNGAGEWGAVHKRSSGPTVSMPERFVFTDVNLDGYTDMICGTSTKQLFINIPTYGLYAAPYIIANSYSNYSMVDINGDSIPEILGRSGTTRMYAQEITQPENFMLATFSNVPATLDEDGTLIDTIAVAMHEIPQETCYFTLYQQSIAPADFELDCAGGTGDSIVLTFLPDSTALDWQYLFVKAYDDPENDDTERGTLKYFSSSATGTLIPALIGTKYYSIVDNDGISPDPASIELVNSIYDIAEGEMGTSVSIFLNYMPEYPVTITIDPDEQLDLGAGAGISYSFTTSSTAPTTFYMDAENDTIVEGDHDGTYVVSYVSVDENYDSIIPTVVTLHISDNDFPLIVENEVQTDLGFIAHFDDELSVIHYSYNTKMDVVMQVYSMSGALLIRDIELPGEGSGQIAVGSWPAGMYLISIMDEQQHIKCVQPVAIY